MGRSAARHSPRELASRSPRHIALMHTLGAVLLRSLFTSQKLTTFIMSPKRQDLIDLKKPVEAGKAKPVPAAIAPIGHFVGSASAGLASAPAG